MNWTFEDLKKKGLVHNYESPNSAPAKSEVQMIGTLAHDICFPNIIIAQRIPVKPLSVNECWQGRRYKTDTYKSYEKIVTAYLEDNHVPEGKYEIKLLFGMSKLSDWDNPIKNFQDILTKKYGFNDRMIYKATVEKVDVKKGEEFIEFQLNLL